MSDWREQQGQELYLKGLKFKLKNYKKHSEEWDHEHCEYCNTKISEFSDDQNKGYSSENEKKWICEDCFSDFKSKHNLIEI